jgi:hypothetical protein
MELMTTESTPPASTLRGCDLRHGLIRDDVAGAEGLVGEDSDAGAGHGDEDQPGLGARRHPPVRRGLAPIGFGRGPAPHAEPQHVAARWVPWLHRGGAFTPIVVIVGLPGPRAFTVPQPRPCDDCAVSEKIIFLASVIFGTVGGIAWSALPSAEPAKPQAVPPVARVIPTATGVAEAPSTASMQDRDWATRGAPASHAGHAPRQLATQQGVYYAGCNEVRAVGKAPLYEGQPGYRVEMDGDGDGIACEPHRQNG